MKKILIIILIYSQLAVAKENHSYRFAFWNVLMDLAVDKWKKMDIPLWHWRKEKVFKKVKSIDPDIIGFAECFPWQANHLQEFLSDYNRVSFGSYTDAVLYYKKEKFKELKSGWFFLSDRPHEAYSVDYGHVMPRLAVWAELQTCRDCESFFVVTTHLDGLKEARQKMLNVIDAQMKQIAKDKTIVLLGDLNISFNDKGYRIIEQLQWNNAYADIYNKIKKQTITYRGRQVDHILFMNKPLFEVKSWSLAEANYEGTNLSDHHMIFSDLLYTHSPQVSKANFDPAALIKEALNE